MDPIYTARAHVVGGRDGRATAAGGHPDLRMAPPPELEGPAEQDDVTNPEELFALGYGACFLSALSYVARQRKHSAKAFTIDSEVSLVPDGEGAFVLAVTLRADMPGVDAATGADLLQEAHAMCPYSRATRGNIAVELFAGEELVA